MKKEYVIHFILSVIIIILLGYVVTEKVDICETAKNDSYNAGFNLGVEQWNSAVIYNINNNGAIPYWVNGSYNELPIAQMCGVQNE